MHRLVCAFVVCMQQRHLVFFDHSGDIIHINISTSVGVELTNAACTHVVSLLQIERNIIILHRKIIFFDLRPDDNGYRNLL